MMQRRTTITANAVDLETLKAEARRLGVPLTRVIADVVAEGAAIRRARRPRPHWGIFDGGGELSRLSVEDEESPARGRLRS